MPCLGGYVPGGTRTTNPPITSQECEPLHHGTLYHIINCSSYYPIKRLKNYDSIRSRLRDTTTSGSDNSFLDFQLKIVTQLNSITHLVLHIFVDDGSMAFLGADVSAWQRLATARKTANFIEPDTCWGRVYHRWPSSPGITGGV